MLIHIIKSDSNICVIVFFQQLKPMIEYNIRKIFIREIGKFWKADTLYIDPINVLSIFNRTYIKVQIVIFTETVHLASRFHFAKFL